MEAGAKYVKFSKSTIKKARRLALRPGSTELATWPPTALWAALKPGSNHILTLPGEFDRSGREHTIY